MLVWRSPGGANIGEPEIERERMRDGDHSLNTTGFGDLSESTHHICPNSGRVFQQAHGKIHWINCTQWGHRCDFFCNWSVRNCVRMLVRNYQHFLSLFQTHLHFVFLFSWNMYANRLSDNNKTFEPSSVENSSHNEFPYSPSLPEVFLLFRCL